MQSIIEDIYEVESEVWESISKSDACYALDELYEKLSNDLLKTLTEHQKFLFNEIDNLKAQIGFEMELTGYKVGFKRGVQIGIEVKEP